MKKIKKWLKPRLYKVFSFSFVLMFHHITDHPKIEKSSCLLDFDKFKEFILHYEGNYVSVLDVAKRKCKRKFAITFDDGLEDVYTFAYPFLKEHKIPFTIFVITDFLDTEGYITTEQLKEMSSDSLVTIGSHGVTHEILPSLSCEEKKEELLRSKQILSDIIGKDVTLFAYSHGQFDDETLAMIIKCYDYAFSTREGLSCYFKWNKHLIPRFDITSQTVDKRFGFFDKIISKK